MTGLGWDKGICKSNTAAASAAADRAAYSRIKIKDNTPYATVPAGANPVE